MSRLLGDASLLVQQYRASRPSRSSRSAAIIEAAEGAGLLVVGLSDRWRDEGLGETRSEIARAPAPVLFVRRGRAPAPRRART